MTTPLTRNDLANKHGSLAPDGAAAPRSAPVEPSVSKRPWTGGPLIAVPDVGCEGLFAVAESAHARVHCASFCTKADATLYAAAPELFEALERLTGNFRARPSREQWEAARAALAKARGQ